MKIVDVCAFYAPQGGGVRTYIDRKLASGPAMGHEIVVIAPGETNRVEERGPGARIIWVESPRFPVDFKYRYFASAEVLHALLDQERPDIVEASSPWRSASMVAAWRGDALRALIMHADPLSAYAYRWFEDVASQSTVDRQFDWYWRHLLRLDARFDAVVSAGASLTDRLRQGGLRRVVTIPMGTEPHLFSPELRDEDLRARLLARCGLGPDATLLLGVGRHAPEKRWPMIIDAVTMAGVNAPVGLVLIGNGRDRAKLLRRAGDNPHVHFLSPIADRPALARLLSSGDALVHGCEAETFGIIAAEARASGLTLIVPDRGGAADQAREAGGYCYASGDTRAAAAAIGTFLTDRQTGPVATKPAPPPRSMDDHFAELFALYHNMRMPHRIAA
ncbi:Glycosyltransferase [Sphingomonas antarctica]|uniref:glycosyltransferase n=1 Tax=Sphingomonas antarctica TaxID=2040274 RepID=UPI0039E78C8F